MFLTKCVMLSYVELPKTSCLIIVTDLSYDGYISVLLCSVQL